MTNENFVESGLALIKHKDILRRKIKEVLTLGVGKYLLVYADKKVDLTVTPTLEKVVKGIIVIDNTSKNRDYLAKNWSEFIEVQTTLVFLDETTGVNWSITPYIHEKIKGSADVKKDLAVLASNA